MAQYCVNRNPQSGGEHEVHNLAICPVPPEPQNRVPLGEHLNCQTAVAAAKQIYPTADGCMVCSPLCHTR